MHGFPWREEGSLLSGEPILRPTVDVQLTNADLTIATKALIDNGAPRCVFPRVVGELIGVTIPQYPSEADKTITLMGRDWPAVSADVDLLLQPFDDQAGPPRSTSSSTTVCRSHCLAMRASSTAGLSASTATTDTSSWNP